MIKHVMKLNLGGGGTYVSHIRWMASIATWTLSVEGGEHKPIQFEQLLVDLWNTRSGWVKFDEGQATRWVMDPDLSTPADKPDEGWGRGFAVYVYNSQLFNGRNRGSEKSQESRFTEATGRVTR